MSRKTSLTTLEHMCGWKECFEAPISPNVSASRGQEGGKHSPEERDFLAVRTHLKTFLVDHAETSFNGKIGAGSLCIDRHPYPAKFFLVAAETASIADFIPALLFCYSICRFHSLGAKYPDSSRPLRLKWKTSASTARYRSPNSVFRTDSYEKK